jgi:hypothetical protein
MAKSMRVVFWPNAKLLDFGNIRWPELTIEVENGDVYRVRIGADTTLPREGNYGRNALIEKVEALKGNIVDIWVQEQQWSFTDRSGVIYYLKDIQDAKGES